MKNSVGIVPVFVSHMGCPNDCSFCNQRKISGIVDAIKPDALMDYVADYLKTMRRDQVELAFFGGSFTGIAIELQNAYLEKAKALKQMGLIHKIRLSTRPDYIDEAVVQRLKAYDVDLVELGCQSFDDAVLLSTQRGHDTQAIYDAIGWLKRGQIDFGIQLMLGLPNDTFEKFKYAVEQTIALRPQCVRLYPALVIRETQLETDYSCGTYKPLSLDEALTWSAFAVKAFYKEDIDVIRIGLQRTDLIDFDAAVLAGPFHPAFGEMVFSQIFYEAIDAILKKELQNLMNPDNPNSLSDETLWIRVNPKQISAAIGNQKWNLRKFLASYCKTVKEINIIGDSSVEKHHVFIEIGDKSFKALIMDFHLLGND